jgi:hypothetical protein
MLGATIASPNRQALRFLGIAIAVSAVLAFPMEQVTHSTQAPGFYWFQNSCGSVEFLLNLGMVVQAILTPVFVFLLPGPGSIVWGKASSSSSSVSSAHLSSVPVVRALARPEDHGGARSRRTASSVEARSLVMVVAVVIGILGLLMFLRSGLVLTHTQFFSDKQSHSAWVTFLRSAVFSETVIELIVGLAGIGAAIYLLYLYMPSQPALFMLVGWLSSAAVPLVWWYGVRGYAGFHGECAALFDSSLPVHVFQPDFLADCAHYFKFLSGFSAVWLGVTAGGLRLQSTRAAVGNSSGNELRQFQNFFWVYLLGWAVQYRLGQWLAVAAIHTNQEWVTYSVMSFVYLIASSLWSLAFIRFFWNLKARTRVANVGVLFCGSWLICLLTALTFIWLMMWAGPALAPLFTLNLSGGAWALTVGSWRWRALQKRASIPVAAAVGTQPQEKRPALLGLRAVEIVGLAVGVFMLVALVLGFVAFYYVTYRFRHHQ